MLAILQDTVHKCVNCDGIAYVGALQHSSWICYACGSVNRTTETRVTNDAAHGNVTPMTPKTKRRKPQTRGKTVYPSETREARETRGRPRVEFSLPQDVVDHLRNRRKETGQPMSELVAEALREYFRIPP